MKRKSVNTGGNITIKIISIICIIIVIANLVLFGLRVYSSSVMWIVILIMALIAFPGMKILKKSLR